MLRLRNRVSMVDTEYGAVLLDEQAGSYYTLNPSAVLVLRELLAGGTAQQAVEALCHHYDVDPAAAATDVQEITDGLSAQGLILS
jgi:hypothetical protein